VFLSLSLWVVFADGDGYSDSLEGQRSSLAYTTLMTDPSLKHVGSNTAYVFFLSSFLEAVFPEGWGDWR